MWRGNKRNSDNLTRTMIARRCSVALGLLVLAGAASAQSQQPTKPNPAQVQAENAAAIEAYLDRPGLRSLLAEHLAARLKTAAPEQKAAIAERLGKLYVEFISAAKTAEERHAWEERARELIRLVPDVKSYELRLDLAKTVYT